MNWLGKQVPPLMHGLERHGLAIVLRRVVVVTATVTKVSHLVPEKLDVQTHA